MFDSELRDFSQTSSKSSPGLLSCFFLSSWKSSIDEDKEAQSKGSIRNLVLSLILVEIVCISTLLNGMVITDIHF